MPSQYQHIPPPTAFNNTGKQVEFGFPLIARCARSFPPYSFCCRISPHQSLALLAQWHCSLERLNFAPHPSLALLAHLDIWDGTYYSTKGKVWTFGTEHTIVLSAKWDGTYYSTKRKVWTFGTEHTIVLSVKSGHFWEGFKIVLQQNSEVLDHENILET